MSEEKENPVTFMLGTYLHIFSLSGELHLGGFRTALYNYLFAKVIPTFKTSISELIIHTHALIYLIFLIEKLGLNFKRSLIYLIL